MFFSKKKSSFHCHYYQSNPAPPDQLHISLVVLVTFLTLDICALPHQRRPVSLNRRRRRYIVLGRLARGQQLTVALLDQHNSNAEPAEQLSPHTHSRHYDQHNYNHKYDPISTIIILTMISTNIIIITMITKQKPGERRYLERCQHGGLHQVGR